MIRDGAPVNKQVEWGMFAQIYNTLGELFLKAEQYYIFLSNINPERYDEINRYFATLTAIYGGIKIYNPCRREGDGLTNKEMDERKKIILGELDMLILFIERNMSVNKLKDHFTKLLRKMRDFHDDLIVIRQYSGLGLQMKDLYSSSQKIRKGLVDDFSIRGT